jgi:DNA-binding MarR family transcriptional regulator
VGEPLSSRASRALVAFTTELDDEFEHRVPHRTTDHGTTAADGPAPWLVSMLMWSTCMRFVEPGGTTVRSLARSAWWLTRPGLRTVLRRMGGWWGYLPVGTGSSDGRDVTPKADLVVRPTDGGRRAQDAWRPLTVDIERRWAERHGTAAVETLRSALAELADRFDRPLPDCLPIYDCDLRARAPRRAEPPTSLPGLLSAVVLAFQVDVEAESTLPMSVTANVLRVVDHDGVRVRDLPGRTGVARAGVDAAVTMLVRRRLATVRPDPAGGRARVVALTAAGVRRRRDELGVLDDVGRRWEQRYGARCLDDVTAALAPVTGDPDDPGSAVWAGLYRYPDGWRSSLPRPATLPRHPVVSHRGGYLDGA